MTVLELPQVLGNFGEFFGAIAVVVTLIYLAMQIRQNTHSMDESRKLAIAQPHQARAALLEEGFREDAPLSLHAISHLEIRRRWAGGTVT